VWVTDGLVAQMVDFWLKQFSSEEGDPPQKKELCGVVVGGLFSLMQN